MCLIVQNISDILAKKRMNARGEISVYSVRMILDDGNVYSLYQNFKWDRNGVNFAEKAERSADTGFHLFVNKADAESLFELSQDWAKHLLLCEHRITMKDIFNSGRTTDTTFRPAVTVKALQGIGKVIKTWKRG